MEKRGVSDVITTVLIVLLVLAAVAIIGGIILKNLGEASEKIEAGFNTVSLSVQGVKVNKDLGLVSFNLVRNAGQGNVKGYNVVIEDSTGQRHVQKYTQSIAELETKPVDVWYPKTSINDVSKISVSPIIGTSTGKEYPSEISSSYKASGSEPLAALDYLVGYWNFDESSGSEAKDLSKNSFKGTLINNPPHLQFPECKRGACLQFDGNNYVQIPDLRNRLDLFEGGGTKGAITVMAWIKPTSLGNNNYYIFTNGFPGFLYFAVEPTNSLRLMIECKLGTSPPYTNCPPNSNTNYWPTSQGKMFLNQWRHVAFILEAGKGYKFYINGSLDKDFSEPGLRISNMGGEQSSIGRTYSLATAPNYNFRGYIDEVIVFNRSLTNEEIKSYYESTK